MTNPNEPTLTCSDCGHPKDDSRYHLDAPGTNWGAALHWYVAPATCSLNESNRTQFESGCSEVVERLVAECIPPRFKPFIHRGQAEKILTEWRERRVQELENLLAKRSGCSHCKDSASGRTSANDPTEIR